MSDRTQKQATAKAPWATFSNDTCLMLANVYGYRVMVKSVSCCCVHGSRVFSNPCSHKFANVTWFKLYIYVCMYMRMHTFGLTMLLYAFLLDHYFSCGIWKKGPGDLTVKFSFSQIAKSTDSDKHYFLVLSG